MRLDDLTNRIAADAVTIDVLLPARRQAIQDAMSGQPGAQHFEVVRSGRSVLWCWTHEREVTACQRADMDCDGEAIDLHDPTGEAAVADDQARTDERDLDRHIRAAARALDAALKIMRRYEDTKLVVERAGIGKCTDCRVYMDGQKGRRLSAYRSGDPVCPACRGRRDRRQDTCPSVLTHEMDAYRCELGLHVTGNHRAGRFEWNTSGLVQREGAA